MNTTEKVQKNKITVYGTEYCSYCHMLKDYLTEKGFTYEYVDVGADANQAELIKEKSGQRGVPVSDIDGHMVIGYDVEKVNELLNIK
jgi:glutaredoxin 3